MIRKLIPRALGLLLLVAAALKFHGLALTPVSPMGWFSAPWFQVIVIQAEVVLGVWLVSGRAPTFAWLLATVTFSLFAAVSFYQGMVGRASCGCFGRLPVSPWYAFGIDIIVLVCLGFGRPNLQSLWEEPKTMVLRPLGALCGWLVGGAVVFGVLLGLASYHFGSLGAATAFFRGERLAVIPSLVDVGEGMLGENRESHITVANYTDTPVRIIGGTSDCACVVTNDLPITVPAGESRPISVRVRLAGVPGIFTRTANLLTADGQSPSLRFRLTGRNLPRPGADGVTGK